MLEHKCGIVWVHNLKLSERAACHSGRLLVFTQSCTVRADACHVVNLLPNDRYSCLLRTLITVSVVIFICTYCMGVRLCFVTLDIEIFFIYCILLCGQTRKPTAVYCYYMVSSHYEVALSISCCLYTSPCFCLMLAAVL